MAGRGITLTGCQDAGAPRRPATSSDPAGGRGDRPATRDLRPIVAGRGLMEQYAARGAPRVPAPPGLAGHHDPSLPRTVPCPVSACV